MVNHQFLFSILLQIIVSGSLANQKVIQCNNRQNYPSLELTADESILTKPGLQQANLKGLKKSVKVQTQLNEGLLSLTLTSVSGNKTILIQVQNAEQAENAWDGIGTLAYGPKQAAEDFKKLFGDAKKNEKIMIVQQLSKKSAYPKTGGFCILQSSR